MLPWLGLLCACAGAQGAPRAKPAQPAVTPASAALDPALELAARLPRGADSCVLVRPSLVPGAQRGLLARISQAEPLAWLAELDLQAYATVQRERSEGASARVTLLWVAQITPQLRSLLDTRAGIALRWDATDACSGPDCGARAVVLDAHVIRIERGVLTELDDPGAEAQCARLAQRTPRAVEVSYARSRRLFGALAGLPLRASATLTVDGRGIHVARIDLMRSMAEAELARQDGPDHGTGPTLTGIASSVRVQQIDAELHTDYDVIWEDLELAREDDARMRDAERHADARETAEPPDGGSADVRARSEVLARLGYHLERAQRGSEDERRSELVAARELLQAALAAQPDDEGLALLLVELLLDARDPAAARMLAHDYAARVDASARFATLERKAAAAEGEAALARVLIAQRLASARNASTLARDILARATSASFEQAEQAVLGDKTPRTP